MIISNELGTLIKGSRGEVMANCVGIMDSLLEIAPEIASAWFKVYADDLKKALIECETQDLVISEVILSKLKEKNNDRHKT